MIKTIDLVAHLNAQQQPDICYYASLTNEVDFGELTDAAFVAKAMLVDHQKSLWVDLLTVIIFRDSHFQIDVVLDKQTDDVRLTVTTLSSQEELKLLVGLTSNDGDGGEDLIRAAYALFIKNIDTIRHVVRTAFADRNAILDAVRRSTIIIKNAKNQESEVI